MYKRILSIILILAGLICLGVSHSIKEQVAEGRQKISSAQKKVNKGKQLFSLTPQTKSLGDGIAGYAQKKIDAGKAEANEYAVLAERLDIAGALLLVAGAALAFFSFWQRRKS